VRRHRTGRVVAFDEARGRGEVEDADGTRRPFHCTQIVDGSRTVPVGATVRYVLRPAFLGVWEAAELEVVAASV